MKQLFVLSLILFIIITACSTLTLQPANFAWPLESVLAVNDEGNVSEDRYSTEFNTRAMFFEEFQDSLAYVDKEIHVIRDNQGFYFITGPDFKNVYVFKDVEGKMVLNNKIFISEFGLQIPAFNQREPYIELVDGNYKMNLTSEGIVEDFDSRREGGTK